MRNGRSDREENVLLGGNCFSGRSSPPQQGNRFTGWKRFLWALDSFLIFKNAFLG